MSIKKSKQGIKTWRFGYDKSKQKAKDIYSDIGTIHCPALSGDTVAFARDGFSHIIRKGRRARTKGEQKRRFVLVQYVEQVVTGFIADIKYERSEVREIIDRYGNKTKLKSKADFWTFISNVDGMEIKVVIRQLDGKQKHFLSVFGSTLEEKTIKTGRDDKVIKKPLKK